MKKSETRNYVIKQKQDTTDMSNSHQFITVGSSIKNNYHLRNYWKLTKSTLLHGAVTKKVISLNFQNINED